MRYGQKKESFLYILLKIKWNEWRKYKNIIVDE